MKSKAHGFFILRRPLLSSAEFFSFQKVVSKDPSLFEAELKMRFSDPLLQHAIRLASEPLYQKLMQLLAGQVDSGKSALLTSLYKYYIRMCTRCTPFGNFAGIATGELNDRTVIRFDTQHPYNTRSKADIQQLDTLRKELLSRLSVLKKLTYYALLIGFHPK